jgi:hypothetical protein
MLSRFSEINTFFNKESFTEDELILLKANVAKRYSEVKERELAESLIKLKLIQFTLEDYSPSKKQSFGEITRRPKKSIRPKNNLRRTSKSKTKKGGKSISSKPTIDYSFIENLTIEEIAKKLDVSIELILRYLRKHQISLTKESKLEEELFKSEEAFFNNFYRALLRKNPKEKPKIKSITKKKGSRKSIAPGVYGGIQKAGGVGKLIYIRKK